MTPHFELLVRGGTCVLRWGEAAADVGIRYGRIAAIGVLGDASADEVISAAHLHVLPGLIDPHVHFRDPGDAAVETMASGTRGAVLGGITSVFDMPNTTPPLIDLKTLAAKQAHVERVAWCDVGLYVGATHGNVAELGALETGRGVCGIKVFAGSSTGDLLVADDDGLERVMRAVGAVLLITARTRAACRPVGQVLHAGSRMRGTWNGGTRSARFSARAEFWRWPRARGGRRTSCTSPLRKNWATWPISTTLRRWKCW